MGKTIENLKVTVTYTVEYGDVEVSDEVYEQLTSNREFSSDDDDNSEAMSWMSDNVHEEDAMDWKFVVDEIDE